MPDKPIASIEEIEPTHIGYVLMVVIAICAVIWVPIAGCG